MGQKGNQNEIVVATGVSVYVNRFSLGQLDVIIFLFIVNKFVRMMQPAEKKEIAPHQPHFIFPVKFISLANRQFFFIATNWFVSVRVAVSRYVLCVWRLHLLISYRKRNRKCDSAKNQFQLQNRLHT